jgi:aarF domain-containing kinase
LAHAEAQWHKLSTATADADIDAEYATDTSSTNNNTSTSTSTSTSTTTTNTLKSRVHLRCAQRLLQLCQLNRGVYIKIGQHLANLDYLLPPEYITTLSALYDNNPISSYDNVCTVLKQDFLNCTSPLDLFDTFDPIPTASASLAQVHVAYQNGKKYAVKVQHYGLRETSRGDLINLQLAVQLAEYVFPNEFTFGWLAEEIAPNLPMELNFIHEGQNAEKASQFLQTTGLSCIVPKIHWDKTSSRVLTMDYEEGCKVTDLRSIERMGLQTSQIAKLISSIFAAQVFLSGHVHCDPHEANVLLRKDETTGQPVIVLVDHGLYKSLDTPFRLQYATLWKSLMLADVEGIMTSCHNLGITDNEACRLFAGIITARPFDEIIERSKEKTTLFSFLTGPRQRTKKSLDTKADQAIIRGYAQRFLPNIIALLDVIPRPVLMLLKMNDCLRHIDYTLGCSPGNNIVVTGHYAAYALYQNEIRNHNHSITQSFAVSWSRKFFAWWSYLKVTARIHINELVMWWIHTTNYGSL